MKFNIITLGCKVNAYESNYISESLENNGFLFCEDLKDADIIIINTCTVTDTSDKKSLKTVRRARRENPHAILVVCGCSSQNNKELYENMDIDILLGNKNKSQIVNIIKEYIEDNNIEINEYNYKNGMISEQEYNMKKEDYKREIEINTLMKVKGEISEEHIEKVSKSFLYKIDFVVKKPI